MNSKRFVMTGVAAVVLSCVAAAYAESPQGGGPRPMGARMERMQKDLGLTADQEAKLKTLRESEQSAMKPLRDKQRDTLKKLADQVSAKASDADIQSTLNDLKASRQALREQMESFQTQRAAILTPTQQAKMMLQRVHRMKEAMGRRGMGMRHAKEGAADPDTHDDHDEPQP